MRGDMLAMLAPKPASLGMRVDGSGPAVRLGWEDVAGALAKCNDPIAADVARAMIAGDGRALSRVIRALATRIGNYQVAYECVRGALVPALCPRCHGRGTKLEGDVLITCAECAGTGRGAREIAKTPEHHEADRIIADWIEAAALAVHEG